MSDALDRIEQFIGERTPHRIVTVNLEYLRHAHSDPAFREALDAADLAVADGMPLVWASRLFRRPLRERIAGVDLADRCAWLAAAKGYGLFLLGAGPGVAQSTARSLAGTLSRTRGGGHVHAAARGVLRRRGTRHRGGDSGGKAGHPARRTADAATGALELRQLQAMERARGHRSRRRLRHVEWRGRARARLDATKRLEWLFRLVREPRRLWKRYLVHDTAVLFRILKSRVAS